MYSVSSTNQVVLPMKISKTLGVNEEFGGIYVARNAQRLIIGYRTAPSNVTQLYSMSPSSVPGSEILIKSDFQPNGTPGEGLDDRGLMFAYTPAEGSRYVLRILSTQTLDYSIPITRATTFLGVSQFRWLPQP